jgi:xylulokinase
MKNQMKRARKSSRAPVMALGFNASTQSFTATLMAVSASGRKKIVWSRRELYTSGAYRRFGAPNGHLTCVQRKNSERFLTDPLMVAAALENSLKALRGYCASRKIDMSRIRAVSPGAQQHATVYLTKKAAEGFDPALAKPLWKQIRDRGYLAWEHSPIWKDTSTKKQAKRLLGNRHFKTEKRLQERTGSTSGDFRFPALQIRKFSEDEPRKWGKTARVLNMTAFLGYLLSGKIDFPWDPGDAIPSYLVDVKTREWFPFVDELIPGLRRRLPEILPTCRVIAPVAPYWAKYGLRGRVANGTGDNPADLVAFNLFRKGRVVISLGTSFTIFQYLSSFKEVAAAIRRSEVGNIMGDPSGKWMKLVCFQNGGTALEKIRDQYIPRKEAIKRGKDCWEIFEEALKETSPGNDGAMMIAQDKEETVVSIVPREGRPFSRGIDDFGAGNRARVLRAAAEGQIFFLKYTADLLGMKIREIYLAGGAAGNASIRRIVADIFGVPVRRLRKSGRWEKEPVSLGMAINAYKAWHDETGGTPLSWEDAARDLTTLERKPLLPNPKAVRIYKTLLPRFCRMVESARKGSEPLA